MVGYNKNDNAKLQSKNKKRINKHYFHLRNSRKNGIRRASKPLQLNYSKFVVIVERRHPIQNRTSVVTIIPHLLLQFRHQ